MGYQIIVRRRQKTGIQRNIDPSSSTPKIDLYFTYTTMYVFV